MGRGPRQSSWDEDEPLKPRDGGPPPAVHAFGRRSPNDVVLFTSHVASPIILRAFRRLQAEAPAWLDVRFLMHLPAGAPPAPNIIGVTDADLRCLAYRAKLPGGQVRIVPGNADLLVLWFARTFPAYERYWTIEYDVDFSGNWDLLRCLWPTRSDRPARGDGVPL